MALEAQNNPFTSVLIVEAADVEALPDADPSAGQQRLAVGTDHLLYLVNSSGTKTQVGGASGAVATDAIWDAAGDLAVGSGANTAAKLTKGSDGTVLTVTAGAVGWATPTASNFYDQPTVTNYNATFAGSGTSNVVTMTAPTAGDKLVAVVYANGRGANSITQTNVVWTQRYTGNGNGSYLEVWTGVVSASAGTTATSAFTGSNVSYVETYVVNSASANFTAASANATATNAGAALASVESAALTLGNHYIVATTATSAVGTSYSGVSTTYVPLTTFGGVARSGILRANVKKLSYWSLSNTSSAWFTAVIQIT